MLTCGFECPSWSDLAAGATAPAPAPPEDAPGVPAGRARGWQHLAAAAVEAEALARLQPLLPAPVQARLRSQGGPGAGMWLNVFPVDELLTLPSIPFLLALRRRLCLELPAGPARCPCGALLDPWGNHLLACHSTGRLTRRGKALELAVAQLCREAGGPAVQVASRPRLRDLAMPGVSAHDLRELDVVARGFPLFGGRSIVVDATLRSPLSSAGRVRVGSHWHDGATFAAARRDKERKYPEFAVQAHRIKFVVAACEIGGRCNQECVDLVRALVLHRSSSAAPALRASLRSSLARRYWGILSVAIQRAGADCLSDDPSPVEFASLPLPSLDTLLLGIDAPFGVDAPDVSRLPPSTEQ